MSVKPESELDRQAERVLVGLLNMPKLSKDRLPYVPAAAIEEFERLHGKPDLRNWSAATAATSFWRAWDHRDRASGLQEINLLVGSILNEKVGEQPTALYLNLVNRGTRGNIQPRIEPQPRDLLDAVALKFLNAYRNILQCERCDERCEKLFIRAYPNDKYCSTTCGSKSHRKKQAEHMRKKRAQEKEMKRQKESKRKRSAR